MPRAPSPKRGKVSGVEKIGRRSMQERRRERVVEESGGERDTEKRGEMPKRSGSLSRDRLHCYCGTTTAQKLDQDFLAPIESSL